MESYVIGVDFGTLSGRAVLASARSGEIAAQRALEYPHSILEGPAPGWALHVPEDYLTVLEGVVSPLLRDAGISPEQVSAIAWDATSCTVLPAMADGTPLASLPGFRENPHAYVKLWKHLTAEREARHIADAAARNCPELLEDYGGTVSAQWMLPKLLQILSEAPEVYARSDLFLEVTDWLTLALTGSLSRSRCCAGFKSFYRTGAGYPPVEFLKKLDRRLEHLYTEKLRGPVNAPWETAGRLRESWARRLGLRPGTPVAAGIIDAHAGLLGSGVTEAGQVLLAMGTSTCQMLFSREKSVIPGIFGVARDSVLPGLYTYEAGQACVGDLLDWFVRTSLPTRTAEDTNIHTRLSQEAASLPPGSGGLLALDWWNGQRSPYGDDRLTGVMLGMTVRTTPVQQYRALMEATAYGTRLILETFQAGGISIRDVFACGGISRKNPVMLQIYADILNRPIRIARQEQTTALGAAILAASAAGLHSSPAEAVRAMTRPPETVYYPNPERAAAYDSLYREYRTLAEYFARENPVMHRLQKLRQPQALTAPPAGAAAPPAAPPT